MQDALLRVHIQALTHEAVVSLNRKKIVYQSNSTAGIEAQHLVLVVAEEGGPLDGICIFLAPVIDRLLALMDDSEVATLERTGKTNDQRGKMLRTAGNVDVSTKSSRWTSVNLSVKH